MQQSTNCEMRSVAWKLDETMGLPGSMAGFVFCVLYLHYHSTKKEQFLHFYNPVHATNIFIRCLIFELIVSCHCHVL